jgi:hypothetical protein
MRDVRHACVQAVQLNAISSNGLVSAKLEEFALKYLLKSCVEHPHDNVV